MKTNHTTAAMAMAVLAAALYGMSSPFSKLLLGHIPPTRMAAFLYLGAGIGMLLVNFVQSLRQSKPAEAKLTRHELPYVLAMIALDIMAPVLLMLGLALTTSSNASLINNFEIAATAMIALFFFREAIGRRMWVAIALITLSSIILSIEDISSFTFSIGSVFVIGACLCWGLENNCTRMLSLKDPLQIVVIKGFGSGLGALSISLALKEHAAELLYILLALLLGFVAYGLSIYFYISAQRVLGAARTSSYYAAAPFIGVLISWLILQEKPTLSFMIALAIMLAGTYFAVTENHGHAHHHETIIHEHMHRHDDLHHTHSHMPEVKGEHSHLHTHDETLHTHPHTPDLHHRHAHR